MKLQGAKSNFFANRRFNYFLLAEIPQTLTSRGIHRIEESFSRYGLEKDKFFPSAGCTLPVLLGNFFPSPPGGEKWKSPQWERNLKKAIRAKKLSKSLEILSEIGIEGDLAIFFISSVNEEMGDAR